MKDLNGDEKNCFLITASHFPITCLNTSYKLLIVSVGEYMREYTIKNHIWDEGQLGAIAGVLGTVDQLIIDDVYSQVVVQVHVTE